MELCQKYVREVDRNQSKRYEKGSKELGENAGKIGNETKQERVQETCKGVLMKVCG